MHARAVAGNENAALRAVADPMPEAADAIAGRHGCDIRTINEIADSDIDAVVICTPTDMHADLIEQFARAKKAIFCEKPIDLDAARVRECLDVVVAEDGFLMVGFNRRFDPHFMAVRKAIDEARSALRKWPSSPRAIPEPASRIYSAFRRYFQGHDNPRL